jgi:hypothetical protein
MITRTATRAGSHPPPPNAARRSAPRSPPTAVRGVSRRDGESDGSWSCALRDVTPAGAVHMHRPHFASCLALMLVVPGSNESHLANTESRTPRSLRRGSARSPPTSRPALHVQSRDRARRTHCIAHCLCPARPPALPCGADPPEADRSHAWTHHSDNCGTCRQNADGRAPPGLARGPLRRLLVSTGGPGCCRPRA